MSNSKKIYGLIPLRKGSTRIKNKNFIKVLDKPLYKYASEQALKSKLINRLLYQPTIIKSDLIIKSFQ